jgi:hypothetical protein
MDPNLQWHPPAEPPMAPPRVVHPKPRRPWLPAAIIGAAIVIAAGLIAGALILKKDKAATPQATGPTTCESWAETQATLRSIPALPNPWDWQTPNIDTYIKNQNAPVAKALDLFEPKINATPADVAAAARDYVAARRLQIQALSNRTYTPEVGATVDTALGRLNELCGIHTDGRPI